MQTNSGSSEPAAYTVTFKVILALAFLSGIPALIYEIIWMRMLSHILGSSIIAISILTATFMLGLSLGSYLFGCFADKVRRYLRLYALIELGIGATAFLFPFLITFIKDNKLLVLPFSYSHHTLFIIQRIVFSSLVLLIPTILMGGTLPVISKFIHRNFANRGKRLGYLYSFNIAGAILGCLLASFIMMEHIGLTRSLLVASSVNITIGLVCLILDHVFGQTGDVATGGQEKPIFQRIKDKKSKLKLSFEQKMLLLIFGLSGFTALAYEVLWVRMLIFWLGATVYSFGMILAVYLGCIAVGSFIAAFLIDKYSEDTLKKILGGLELFIGLAALIPMYLYSAMVKNSIDINNPLFFDYSFVDTKTGLITTILTFFLLAIPFGIIFPLMIKILSPHKNQLCGCLGLGYAINTLGAVFGSLVTGFILIPVLGVQNSLFAVACLSIAIFYCIVLLVKRKMRFVSGTVLALCLVLLMAGLHMAVPKDFLGTVISTKVPGTIVHFKEGRDSTVIVNKDTYGNPHLWINGLETADPSMPLMSWIAHVPMLISSNPQNALVIGFGSGLTMGTATEVYGVKTDCVEISRSVIEVGEAFSAFNHDVLNSPRATIIVMDGRNFVDYTDKIYDIIIVDGGHPFINNCSSLFSKEFYLACHKILKNDGIMVQFAPRVLASREDYESMVQTFAQVFKYSFTFPSLSDDFVFGTKKSFLIDEKRVREKLLRNPVLQKDMAQIDITNANGLVRFLNSFRMIERKQAKNTRILTDDMPFIEFTMTRYLRDKGKKDEPIHAVLR